MGPEAKIEGRVVEIFRARYQGISWKLNTAGSTGVPDRIFLFPGGGIAFIEFKAPGGVMSAKQKWWKGRILKAGFPFEVHDTVEGAMMFLADVREGVK